ncbi:MAG: hypothetical protein HXS46_09790 [Theionarchaea archaeon]|nr:hypothetical protein [Theionarchaea archaeon]
MKFEEKKNLVITFVLIMACWILATYSIFKGRDTCRDSLIISGLFLLMALIGYWRLGKERKKPEIYLYYLLLLMLVLYVASIIENGCCGLTPYGQYFRNVKEYINPANGHLTITQTDLKGTHFKDYLMSQWGLNIGQIDVSTCTKMRKLG